MNYNVVKGACLFITGFAAGSAATYLYIKKHNVIEYEYVKPAAPVKETAKDEESDVVVKTIDEDDSQNEEDVVDGDIMQYYNEAANNVNSQHLDYASISKPNVENVPEERKSIYEITGDEFLLDEPALQKEILALYVEDGVLVRDEDDTIIDNINDAVTYALFENFQNDEDSDEIFVRNLMYGTDYQIYKRHESYEETR